MTDRHAGYIVTLEKDIREDDAQTTLAALMQIKGVIGVEPVVADIKLAMAHMRASTDMKQKLVDAFFKPTATA